MGLIKTTVRIGVIGALVGGTAVAIAGPHRIGALLQQAQGGVNGLIDSQIGDPVALRSQLRSLEAEYPKRIAEVRSELSALQQETADLEREFEVSEKVVELADAELGELQGLLARAEAARTEAGGATIVKVRYDGQSMSLDQAFAEANQKSQVRSAYATKAADLERDLGLIAQQEERLMNLLTQLETERAQFQAQLWDLDRQIDAIARNERMIEILDKRDRTFEQLDSPYHGATLTQLKEKLAKLRAEQESKLSMLADSAEDDLHRRATLMLDHEAGVRAGEKAAETQFNGFHRVPTLIIEPREIEITPEDEPQADAKESGKVASRG